MLDETQLLRALFAAATSQPDEASAETIADQSVPKKTWEGFLTVLAGITHADSVQLHLVENGRPLQHWQVGNDLDALDISASERMRTSRVYSQSDLPSDHKSDAPLRAMRWRIGRDAWGVIILKRRAEDFRAMDGQHLSNLLPYLAPAILGWHDLNRERTQAAITYQICADLGAGWIIFASAGQVSAMAIGLAERLEALCNIRLSAEGRLLLPPAEARNLRDALSAAASGNTDPQTLWLSSVPPVQMVLSTERYAEGLALVGRLRLDLAASALPLSRIMTAFDLNRSEARLAAALCDGLSLSEAAQTLGWTIETARSNSKQLFAHMGVGGQLGVVRAMQTSAIWLQVD
jgi:hypothetical protein